MTPATPRTTPPASHDPASLDVLCPRCTSSNYPRATVIWRDVDERGAHFSCDVCAHIWAVSR